jgi:hypothetical protein
MITGTRYWYATGNVVNNNRRDLLRVICESITSCTFACSDSSITSIEIEQ